MKTKLELALEKAKNEDEAFKILHTVSMFYHKHLLEMILLNDEHNFLSLQECDMLKRLAMILENRIMEKVSEVRTNGLSPYYVDMWS